MSNVLFDVSDERKPLPTLRQWVNSLGKRKMAQLYPVVKVWKPGKYKNIVFETDAFRAVLYDGNVLYPEISKRLDEICSGEFGLAIAPMRDEPGRFEIHRMDNECPTVRFIGEFGYQFEYHG